MKHTDYRNILRGVSTLDAMKKNLKAILFLVILTAFVGNAFGGHSTLDIVDPTFNPEVVSNLYGGKLVNAVQALPDGKILALGTYSSYNRVPTGKLVRLNADGSLDTTFNNQTVISVGNFSPRDRIIPQADGKIIVRANGMITAGQPAKNLLRFNSDGTLDTSFNFTLGTSIITLTVDSLGRLVLLGTFTTPQGARRIVRINDDGSLDNSFNNTTVISTSSAEYIAAQGNKIIVAGGNYKLFRLNENGSEDASFPVILSTGFQVNTLIVQPDNKILYLLFGLKRLNADGSLDNTFQTVDPGDSINIKLGGDGKIVAAPNSNNAPFQRFLSNGAPDTSFGPYTHPAFISYTIQPDNKIVIGDQSNLNNSTLSPNNFVRLNLDGTLDSTFNPGGIGFQNILPAGIRAIEPQADGKILLGGKFDVINEIPRLKLARLNADSTVDPTFQINTSGSGNYFSIIRDVYQIRAQADGKIVVSGWFDYVQDGVSKRNFVRLNPDGSIDTTFNLTEVIHDFSEIVFGGRNRFLTFSDGKLLVGTSKNDFGQPGPLKLTEGGARDTSFNSTINSQSPQMFIDDITIQPDGKILIVGSHRINYESPMVSYVARLNADGSVDSTFTYSEEPGRLRSLLLLLPSGKILVSKHSLSGNIFGKVERLNADGTPDNTFNSLSMPGGIINALLLLPNGKVFVGGKFTFTVVTGQQTKNLLRLNNGGIVEPTTYNLNEEVLGLAADSEGRVLVGGGFTVIGTGGAGATRSYVARLIDSVPFDFDGDGKADISIFRPTENRWYIIRSSDGGVTEQVFALSGDIPTPGDWDGDGRTDFGIYRPSSADWWNLSSINNAHVYANWGFEGVVPLPSDIDGDGKTDYVVYYPGNNYWYRYGTSAGASFIQFGAAGDKPVIADFDGDDKTDLAIYRPATGEWWWQSSIDNVPRATQWGISTDIPVPADYDGDGKTDIAIYRESSGEWWILNSSNGTHTVIGFGGNVGDKPVAADYDGDGKDDIAIYRPLEGNWYLYRSVAGFTVVQFGGSGDIPVPNAFVP